MEVSNQIQLKFHGVDFPIINLNSNRVSIQKEENKIDIEISPKVFYPKDEPNFFRIIQEIKLSSKGFFELSIVALGTFEIKGNVDEETKKNFVNINAPAIMFPYVRSFISTLSTNIGNVTETLTIPTQFFKGELEEITNLHKEES